MNSLLRKFLFENNFFFIYSESILKHLMAFLIAMSLKGFRGKMVELEGHY
jgi:hypothetical protein